MIRPELLEILRCPETHQRLSPASADLIAQLNSRIKEHQLRNRAGKTVEDPLEAGLLRQDGAVLYPIRGNLPIMLIDEGVLLGTPRPGKV